MKPTNALLRSRLFVATFAAATLCSTFTGTAHAEEERSKSNSFSWNFNIGFGNHIGYGQNRTKGSGVVKEEVRAVSNFSKFVRNIPASFAACAS